MHAAMRHQLRHRRHRHPPRDDRAHRAADGHAADDQREGDRVQRVLAEQGGEGGQDGDGHADHAHLIAPPAGHRAGKAPERQDEQDAGDDVEDGR
jgi:hypothetical protein